ncbi:hypothetical protein FRC04_009529 [Tulasnella sp. 424]|nr:hypothetical protein FRC04_009529 [Tulasnella sp. 424]
MPDIRPYVSVVWNSSAYPARPVLNAGVSTVPTTRGTEDFNFVTNVSDSPREFVAGVTFNFTAGQTLRVDVGRRRIYMNRATFLDLIGISQSPDVYVTYPILSLVPGAPSAAPELSTLNFYPGFGAYNDELYEEYLENTVLSGLSATGGLYSAFDVIYILIFGRSLLAALFGGKPIAPFGALASMIQRESFCKGLNEQYPGILGKNPKEKAEATCEFLHDFILDLKPLEPPKEPSDDPEKPNSRSDAIQNDNDIEFAGGIMADASGSAAPSKPSGETLAPPADTIPDIPTPVEPRLQQRSSSSTISADCPLADTTGTEAKPKSTHRAHAAHRYPTPTERHDDPISSTVGPVKEWATSSASPSRTTTPATAAYETAGYEIPMASRTSSTNQEDTDRYVLQRTSPFPGTCLKCETGRVGSYPEWASALVLGFGRERSRWRTIGNDTDEGERW